MHCVEKESSSREFSVSKGSERAPWSQNVHLSQSLQNADLHRSNERHRDIIHSGDLSLVQKLKILLVLGTKARIEHISNAVAKTPNATNERQIVFLYRLVGILESFSS